LESVIENNDKLKDGHNFFNMHKCEKSGDTSDSLCIEERIMVTEFGVSPDYSHRFDGCNPQSLSSFPGGKQILR
jgi:hypothetical protein